MQNRGTCVLLRTAAVNRLVQPASFSSSSFLPAAPLTSLATALKSHQQPTVQIPSFQHNRTFASAPSTSSSSSSSSSSQSSNRRNLKLGIIIGLATTGLLGTYIAVNSSLIHSEGGALVRRDRKPNEDGLLTRMFGSSQLVPRDAAGLPKSGPGSKDSLKKRTSSGLPYYSRDEVRSHTSKETGIWVTRGDAVYDITQFVDVHPGGEKILLAAGQSIDPFWNIFSIHQSDSTRELLEQYRIGDLVPLNEDTSAVSDAEATVLALAKLFENDPKRHSSLIVRSARPCNAESPAEALSTFTTPNDVFYVRNHLPVPKIDPEEFCLEIDLPGLPERSFTLQELKEKFPKVTVMATLQCAGNRRFEMHAAKPVKGLLWQRGAIGNATWSGVMLSDVLKYAAKEAAESEGKTVDSVLKNGYSNELAGRPEGVLIQAGQDLETVGVACKHVHFEGAEGYGASIPLSKAISEEGDVLLAYEMNGEPLPADHGFPLRSIVPGHVAARSVKWLKKISVSDEESHSHWQRKDYKGFGPSKTLETSKYEASESIQEMPVQSAVLSPKEGDVVKIADTVAVEGYAWSGGGRGIVRVDVSADGGKTWHDATVLKKPGQPRGREWAWTRWEASVPVSKETSGPLEIVCKAVDTSYNEQPERMESVYNVRGVLVSAWHRVKVEAKKAEDNKP